MSEGLISINRNQIITTINTQACKMLGLSPLESSFWVGKHVSEIGDITEEYLNKTIQFKSKFFAENMTIKINGQKKRFMINCTPYEDILYDDDDKEINGALLILNKSNNIANKVVGAKAKTLFEDMIGESSVFLKAVEQAKIASDNSSNILLTGESGVGKDLLAQAIHNASPRRNEPFLGINCAAIPRELISSELFGYEEGAFTGARKGGNPGKFELVDQGTIFLDEIAEMPIDLQASLLRVLEERNIIRLGGKHFIPVNVRIITATNRNLLQQIEANSFRQDLYFRLNVISIHLPALRERKGDIPLLVENFVHSLSNRLNKTVKHVKPEVYDCLINYDWPGNIRELNNIIERAINLCSGDTLTLDLIPAEIQEATMNTGILKWKKSILQEDEEKERQLIEYYLSKKSNNRSQVAKLLKISRSSLYRKMQKYNIY
jgi:transcriptional regulator with PAS, ATPase and Fis domain